MAVSKDTRKKAALKRASARAAGRTRKDVMVPGRITEAGVSNIPGTVARAVMAVAGRSGKSAASKYPTSNVRVVPSRGPGARKPTTGASKSRTKTRTSSERPMPTANSPRAKELAAKARARKARKSR